MAEGAWTTASVLVVEDESFTRMVLVRMVKGLGVGTVHQAADGQSGLAVLDAHTPGLILCDVEMQPMDGFSFLRHLRAHPDPRRRSLPVVFMSNRADEERVAEARAAGVEAILAKPATPDTLRQVLTERLSPLE